MSNDNVRESPSRRPSPPLPNDVARLTSSPARRRYEWVLFYAPLVAIYVFALRTLYHMRCRLARGLAATLAARARVLAVNALTLLTNLAYWLAYTLLSLLMMLAWFQGNQRVEFCLFVVWSFHRSAKVHSSFFFEAEGKFEEQLSNKKKHRVGGHRAVTARRSNQTGGCRIIAARCGCAPSS